MTRLFLIVIIGLLAGGAVAEGAAPDRQKHPKRQRAHDDVYRSGTSVAIDVHFSQREVHLIRTHYAPRYRSLPPGLQKKLRRGGALPPGWRKKLEPFPVALERDLVVLPAGYRRGVIDGHAVIYRPGTQVIIDVAVLF